MKPPFKSDIIRLIGGLFLNYIEYKTARNLAWQTLLECGCFTTPIDLERIIKINGITIKLFSHSMAFLTKHNIDAINDDGFALVVDNKKTIFINDKKGTKQRKRFTLAHEIGHILLEHNLTKIKRRTIEIDYDNMSLEEMQANVFARDLLMPACFLYILDLHTADEIAETCNVSIASATIRAKRMRELYTRNKFGTHPLEARLMKQFIENNYL